MRPAVTWRADNDTMQLEAEVRDPKHIPIWFLTRCPATQRRSGLHSTGHTADQGPWAPAPAGGASEHPVARTCGSSACCRRTARRSGSGGDDA